MNNTIDIKRINRLEALALQLVHEVTELKKKASPVQAKPSRKGPALSPEKIAHALAKRRRAMERIAKN